MDTPRGNTQSLLSQTCYIYVSSTSVSRINPQESMNGNLFVEGTALGTLRDSEMYDPFPTPWKL